MSEGASPPLTSGDKPLEIRRSSGGIVGLAAVRMVVLEVVVEFSLVSESRIFSEVSTETTIPLNSFAQCSLSASEISQSCFIVFVLVMTKSSWF